MVISRNCLLYASAMLHPLTISSHSSIPQPLAITRLLSASMSLTILVSTYKWDDTVFVFLCLAYLVWHNILQVHPFFLQMVGFSSLLKLIFHCNWYTHTHIHTPHIFFVHLSADAHLGCFHTLAAVNNAAASTREHASLWGLDPSSFHYTFFIISCNSGILVWILDYLHCSKRFWGDYTASVSFP